MRKQWQILSEDELAALAAPDRIPRPDSPRVVDVEVREFEDSIGEPAVQITVVVENAIKRGAVKKLEPFIEAVREAIIGAGEPRPVYTQVMMHSTYRRWVKLRGGAPR